MTVEIDKPVIYDGGCHCGAVRFRVVVEKHEADECNCSICKKKGFLHLIVPPEKFTLLSGEDVLRTYTFNTGVAKHTFCGICGIHAFYRPRSHPNDYDVNVRCLDGDAMSKFRIIPFDGANWEQSIDQLHSRVQPS
ncbi:GFA family protein [Planktothrix sp. FACHB-1355]|uniref:GFA family protein n=1 Tax=Aerosakkonema funiforme FACHB-1375 TaxID=2949571 RepID=A0A926VJF2_9CYAN|nr:MULTISPECIES: GFA family protein [Oscillatoriales]MBD2185081.1 GFA family protein [Aerosakkonema funiforme FACHB-1375]MBD3559146.1 GFA family protein [Planktothrix sp. FACHB-1355]